MDTNEPAGTSGPRDQNDHPTTPLPWLDDAHAETTAPPAAAPGTAVTNRMKAAEPASGTSFLRRHAVGVGVTAAVLAVVLMAGGTAWGVSAAVAANETAAPAATSTATHTAKGGAAAKHRHAKRGAVGTLTAIAGDTWTLHSAAGATLTVTVGAKTKYGTAKKPATASSFAVGDRIAVFGARSGDTVTAKRIVHLPAAKHAPRTGTPSPAPTT